MGAGALITVLTWFWTQLGGRTAYTPAHVAIWADMVRRHLSVSHRLAVVTNEDLAIPGVETIRPPREFEEVRIPTWGEHRPQCLRRLVMFRRDAAQWFGERFVCMDMDCVISGPLDPLFRGEEEFRICAGTAPGRPYNGSMMLLRAGARPQVYDDFTPVAAAAAGKRFVGSDQAWIAHCLGPDEPTWGKADGVAWWHGREPAGARVTFFPGGTKPWEMDDPFVASHYRRSGARAGLSLGRGSAVWDEAEAALERRTYDGVIALREPARHWPGEIEAVADNEAHALRLAAMLGFSEWTFCGRAI
jgi:hypothetical protein